MAFNLFSLLQNEFSSDVIGKIASFVGETPAKTQTALTAAVPAVMCAVHQKVANTGGADDLLEMLQRGGFDGKTIGTPANVADSPSGLADLVKRGAPLVTSLFGSRVSGLVDWLAGAADIGKSASSSLLGLAVPFALNLIGRQASSSGGLNAAAVAELITGPGSFLGGAAPQGRAAPLGVSQFAEAPARAYGAAAPAAPAAYGAPADADGDTWKWVVLPVLGMIALSIATVWWFAHQAESVHATTAPPVAATTPPPAAVARAPAPAPAPAPSPAAAALVKQTICAGQLIEVGANGVESMLIAFLDDKTSVIGPNTRFSFDRIEFETDSAALKPSSRAQIKNIAEIMKCYPTLEMKIAGHTDSKADDAYNLKLSQERADNAKSDLVALGVAPSRLAAQGYGEEFPIADNDTEEGRARNRRTDIVVTKK
ncbi:OmpA family protein [Lamprocystis purpurea]|jgi:outer membrane protein OmpA-like peptidoglycan-associated protein|uniref:OmpA family protein n=1 Tax=Lamprocystis purpurea TaxID=61598 RepID=UPI0003682751|nr:OmpA family protein [Lamprocystis purpurea]